MDKKSEDNQSQMNNLKERTKELESKHLMPQNVFKSDDQNQIGTNLDLKDIGLNGSDNKEKTDEHVDEWRQRMTIIF